MNKLLIICGPTATGKTSLGVSLAKKFNGEIVSADSRQVYKGMDVLTGKDLPANSKLRTQNSKLDIDSKQVDAGYRLKDDIPVWLVDIVEPDYIFNVGEYSILAKKTINYIWSRDKLPIVVGGTGLYINSIVETMEAIQIPPDKKLRKELKNKPLEYLQDRLKKENKAKWEKMNQSDRRNPRRLIRALEIAKKNQKSKIKNQKDKSELKDSIKSLIIGLISSKAVLSDRIYKRVEDRINQGAINEVKWLLKTNHSPSLPALTSSGVKELKEYFEGKKTISKAASRWKAREVQYAKRQMTWFKKDKRIHWFDIKDKDYKKKIEKLVRKWYTYSI